MCGRAMGRGQLTATQCTSVLIAHHMAHSRNKRDKNSGHQTQCAPPILTSSVELSGPEASSSSLGSEEGMSAAGLSGAISRSPRAEAINHCQPHRIPYGSPCQQEDLDFSAGRCPCIRASRGDMSCH